MTASPMTMNRLIHAAVRRDLGRLGTALDHVEGGDRARAEELDRAYVFLRHELTRHHEGEDELIWPMLAKAGVSPELLSDMEDEHRMMSRALAETGAAMTAFARSGSKSHAEAARESLDRTTAVVERHLAHEEAELEPALLPYLETPEWQAVEKQLRRQSLDVAGSFFAWLTDGMTDEGRAFLRSTVPAPVVFLLSRLFGRRYNRDVAPALRPRTG